MARTVDHTHDLLQPVHIGRYRILERIGRGAMGVVYRAFDEAMGRDVALKILSADAEDDAESRTRFQREAEAAAHLSHPNIVTVFDIGEEHGRLYLVMELLRGDTLKQLLRNPGCLALEQKLDLMIQLCAGLGAAHAASIYHRDIKPGNVFVRSDGILKILDFGVARLSSSGLTASGFIVGTPDYMSPEQARGAEIDGRSDLFSAGGVFYFMLTGRKPFPAGDLPTLFRQIQEDPPRPIDDPYPAELVALIMKALSKNRDARHQTCFELKAELERVRERYHLELQPMPDAGEHAAAAGAARGAGVAPPTAPSFGPEPETDDTVDLGSSAPEVTDDTVPLTPVAPRRQRVAERIDSAVTRARARLRRAVARIPHAPGSTRGQRG